MSKPKAFLLALFLIGGVAVLLFVFFPGETIPPQRTVAQKVSLRGYDEESVLIWSLEAKEGQMKDDTGTLAGVELVFYTEGKERLQVMADTLVYEGKRATLSGGVKIYHEDYQLQTETITWIESERTLSAGKVAITSNAARLEAETFNYNLKTERALLEGGVSATLASSSSLRVLANRAEAKDGRLTLIGGVSVKGKEESYRCANVDYNLETEAVSLSGGVEGTFAAGRIRACSVTLTSDGLSAYGEVNLRLDQPFFRGTDGA